MSKIIIGITGSISAYKSIQLISDLQKKGHDLEVIMTESAVKLINTNTIQALIKKHVYVDTFDDYNPSIITHVDLVKDADLFFICPASANTIAKCANGLADNMLTDAYLAATCPKMIAPAMNVHMYENVVTQRNLNTLSQDGVIIIEPCTGQLACGDTGKGKLPDESVLMDYIDYALSNHPLIDKTVLITAGPTQEAIDPVRYITNHSSGKMGYAIAKVAYNLGANVILVSGPTHLLTPIGVNKVDVISAKEMYDAVFKYEDQADYIICSAAVGDYCPSSVSDHKIKKDNEITSLSLSKNPDILYALSKKKHCKLVGFAMETENLIENAKEKLNKKHLDMIVANSLKDEGAGFQTDTNIATIITKDHTYKKDLMSKEDLAKEIFSLLLEDNTTC